MSPFDFRALDSARLSFTSAVAQRAIYFDYEALPRPKPELPEVALLGWNVDGHYAGRVVNPILECCAGKRPYKTILASSRRDAIATLVRKAESEDRAMVSWSHFDARLAWSELSEAERSAFRLRYVDARQVARPWHRNTLGEVAPNGATLSHFSYLFHVSAPPQFGEHVMASNLEALKASINQGAKFGDEPSLLRAPWTTVVKHNKWDLEQLIVVVARVLAGAAPAWGKTVHGKLSSSAA